MNKKKLVTSGAARESAEIALNHAGQRYAKGLSFVDLCSMSCGVSISVAWEFFLVKLSQLGMQESVEIRFARTMYTTGEERCVSLMPLFLIYL